MKFYKVTPDGAKNSNITKLHVISIEELKERAGKSNDPKLKELIAKLEKTQK